MTDDLLMTWLTASIVMGMLQLGVHLDARPWSSLQFTSDAVGH